jgi:hypothetical protein
MDGFLSGISLTKFSMVYIELSVVSNVPKKEWNKMKQCSTNTTDKEGRD